MDVLGVLVPAAAGEVEEDVEGCLVEELVEAFGLELVAG